MYNLSKTRFGQEAPPMEEQSGKTENAEFLLKNLSVYISVISFWVFTFSWNYLFDGLEFVPRLGLGAALSWVVFLHVESIGMIIMTMMKEKWQSEAREARAEAREARAREALAEAREARAQETIRDLRRQLRESRGEDVNGGEGA